MQPRSDIAKCDGGGLDCCEHCTRNLAPKTLGQNWTVPIYGRNGQCVLFASAEKYGHLYGMTKKEIARHANGRSGK